MRMSGWPWKVRSTTADWQIGYGARAFPHAVIELD
jgi:hypothetical protein